MSGRHRAGDDLDIFVPQVKDVLGRLVDLTGATLFCDVQHDGVTPGSYVKVAAAATVVDALTGTARARFSAAQTILWPPNTDATYDGRVRLANGQLGTVVEGSFIILAPITPQPP